MAQGFPVWRNEKPCYTLPTVSGKVDADEAEDTDEPLLEWLVVIGRAIARARSRTINQSTGRPYSQKDVAAVIGIGGSTVPRVELGKATNARMYDKAAHVVGLTINAVEDVTGAITLAVAPAAMSSEGDGAVTEMLRNPFVHFVAASAALIPEAERARFQALVVEFMHGLTRGGLHPKGRNHPSG